FTQAVNSNGNYVKFSITATGFTLSAIPGAAGGNKRAPVNGIQIVPAGPPSPDFTIAATPASNTVIQGSAGGYTVNVGALNGFAGDVSLSATRLPAGAPATFMPSLIPGGAGNSSLNVSTMAGTPAGSFTLTITG